METIDQMSESDCRQLLHKIADQFMIGSNVRSESVILKNVSNSANHDFCIKPPTKEVIEHARNLPESDPLRDYVFQAAGIDEEEEKDEYQDWSGRHPDP